MDLFSSIRNFPARSFSTMRNFFSRSAKSPVRPGPQPSRRISTIQIRQQYDDPLDPDRYRKKGKRKPPDLLPIDTTQIKTIAGVMGMADKNPDEVLRTQGISAYDDMEAKDPHVYAVYQTRKLAISLTPWLILPGSDSDRDLEIAEFVFTAIEDSKGPFSEDIKQLLDAIGKGFSILEIIWKYVEEGRWKGKYMIEELIFHKQKYWYFKDRRWHKSEESVVIFGDSLMSGGQPVPWEKLIHFAYDSEDNLYGRAAFKPIYWFSWFKKEGWKSWIVFLQKYGSPTVAGKYPDGATPTEQANLMSMIETIQEETGIIFPADMEVSFLEPTYATTASYRELSDACNAEISKGILGATQTVEEGRRGSYALSRAHSEVRQERTDADTVDISDVIQEQLIKRLVDFNYITDIYPQFIMRKMEGKETLPPGKGRIGEPVKKSVDGIPKKTPEVKEPSIEETPAGEAPEKEPAGVKPPSLEDEIEAPSLEGKVKVPEIVPKSEMPKDLKRAFDRVKSFILKSYEKKRHPVINVSAIKSVLTDKYGEDKAYKLAGSVKSFIESQAKPENIDEVFDEAMKQLQEEIVK